VLKDVRIVVMIGAGHVASGLIGVGPHAHTVAGVSVAAAVRGWRAVLVRRVPGRLGVVRVGAVG
jgi:predicted nucleotidyltransferase